MAAKKKTTPDVKPLESAANTLRGISMHLGIIMRGYGVADLREPMTSIEEVIATLDEYTERCST